ncbi:DUF2868 domain-containing protein [Orbus sturtevantii]|uniref:DUF2868 domain-containing protein n=1 Tax=Orbus sturtevantii TaxID=3074109 RepID=UPI00370D3161
MNQYLKSLWLTETVRLIEKDGARFDDDEANRQARSIKGDISARIIKRADILSEQHGLKKSQQEWLHSAKLSFFILFIIALFTGAGLAFSALANNPVNLYWALLCLLGFHFVTLCLWLISCIFLPNESGSFFIHLWLWLAKKIAKKSTASQVLPAFITVFNKQLRWLIGLIVNLLWSVILFSALIVLVALLSTKNYSFEWQTTLLSADAVITITHFLGELPTMLGFSLPDNDTIRASEQAMVNGEIRSAWAVWLLGIFIVYGVAIRLILFIFCGMKWRFGCQNISLSIQYPQYQLLINELDIAPIKYIVDQDGSSDTLLCDQNKQIVKTSANTALVAIDIEPNWSPPNHINFLGFLNSNEQRKAVLDFLQQHPANKLLIAIDTDRSPDRGIINLIQLLAVKAADCRIWFINQGRQLNNWQESLSKLKIVLADTSWLLDEGDNAKRN